MYPVFRLITDFEPYFRNDLSMNSTESSLCFPDQEKTCFACCPPIRQVGYDHIQYRDIIKRILRENTKGFRKEDKKIIPITGFSCWALGYVDKNYKLVGCMLHPAQNRGIDFRYRIDYGDKCRREICQEAKVFSELDEDEKRFWLQLTDGLDSFAYSSKKMNPLFSMMGWGTYLLRLVAEKENNQSFQMDSFFKAYPFFTTKVSPRANIYLINHLISEEKIHLLRSDFFRQEFEEFTSQLLGRINHQSCDASDYPRVHLLDLDQDFLLFLRLSVGISKINEEDALVLKEIVDEQLKLFEPTIP